MTPDAFGIVTTLYALSAACCVTPTDALAVHEPSETNDPIKELSGDGEGR